MLEMKLLTTPLIMGGLMAVIGLMHATSINTTNSVQPFGRNSGVGGLGDKSVLGINISATKLYGDKHLSTIRPSSNIPSLAAAASTLDSGDRRQSRLPVLEDYGGGNIHNDVLYEINKSNQEHTKSRNRLTSAALGGNAADSSFSSSYFERVEWQESRTSAGNKDKLVLHRHKRYLLFPDGSSFQLVFDLIIPIVDYTNFAIMGITCAVAWELPSKPPSEIIDNFRQKLNDGTLGFSRRNDSDQHQLQYINDQEPVDAMGGEWENNNRPPQNQLSPATAPASASALQQTLSRNGYYANTLQQPQISNKATPKPTHFYHQQPDGDSNLDADSRGWSMSHYPNKLLSQSRPETNPSASWKTDNWWERNKDRVQTQWQQNQWKWKTFPSNQRIARNRKLLSKRPKHRIYSVFGKRRRRNIASPDELDSDDDLTKNLNEIHTKQHLDTRHTLYAKIEKLYKTRGHNGTACVLRTLCETQKLHRKRRHGHQPNTFVMELLRVIFSLPPEVMATKSMDSPYIAAMLQAHKVQSCSHQYDGCELPIWRNVQM